MVLLTRTIVALGTFTALSYPAACSNSSSSPSPSSSPAFPVLASYDHSCAVDSDCVLVRGEGCASCDTPALSAKAAAAYNAAYTEAQKDPACQRLLETAGPCSVAGGVEARCAASRCIARAVAADAGGDANADASPSDASTD